jgi:alkanesulfonate monooxygenase SsuD/methylene tetrahydromethanopterin reductase-like flavin-dependent oxidoreductase (luciferase family)
LIGDPGAIARHLRAIAAAGFGTILVWPDPNDLRGIEAMAPVLERLAGLDESDG